MSKTKQDKKNLIYFPLGTIGRDMVYCLISSFLLNYIMFTKHLDKAQLAAVTGIMVFARLFDAFNDPIMGNIIEGTRTKWGKFKPWQLIGCVSTAFVVFFTYNSQLFGLDGWPFIIFFGIMYILYSITFTMSDISYWGMVPALSSDADTRNQITSRATLFAGIGGTAISVLVPMLTAGENAIGGNAVTAYSIIALVVGISTPVFILFTLFGTKEKRVATDETPKTKVSFKKIFSTIGGNDQLLWISVIFLVQQIGSNIVLNGIGSTYIYFKFGYDGGKYSLFTTIGMMATALLMVFYPVISRKVNRKPLMGFMMIISTVGYILMFVSGVVPMDNTIGYYVLVVGYMLGNFGCYSYYLIMMISIMNTVEYNELHHGTRDEGIITSLRPFITKLASALVVIITSAVYMVLNVTDYTNVISEQERLANAGEITEEIKTAAISEKLATVTSGETIGLLIFISVVPLALMFISYVLYKKKYKLDEAEYERICKELEAKRTEM